MKIAFRLGLTGSSNIRGASEFHALLSEIQKWNSIVDEVCLFTESWHHGYISPEHIEELQPILAKRMELLRQAGVPSVGLNVLETVGQLDEGWDWLDPVPFQTMVGHDGQSTFGMMCIRTREYQEYIRYKYTRYAQAKPDFIWLDDDIRPTGHGPAGYPCFCHHCVREFNRRMHTAFRRESLVEALNAPDGGELREAWTRFIHDGYDALMRLIESAVHAVDPRIQLGLMTIQVHGDTYGQADHMGLMQSLKAAKIRPGEGVYDDYTPAAFAEKALYVSDQLRDCPPVDDRQYELEDFPCNGRKSVRMHVIELTAALMAGCNGVAMNMHPAFQQEPNPVYGSEPILQALEQHRPQWREMVEAGDTWQLAGGSVVFDKMFDAKRAPHGNWFSGLARQCWNREISPFLAGLPYTPFEEQAAFVTLSGHMAETLDDARLQRLLSGGVLIDGGALMHLCRRGYGDLTGCSVERVYHSGMRETFHDDPRNGAMAGQTRDVYQTFYRWNDGDTDVYSLKPAPGAVVLSHLSSITGVACGVGACAYENALGGRVIACGYLPWRFAEIPRRTDQLRRFADWLSRDRMPLRMADAHRVFPMYKRSAGRSGFALMLVNCSMDPAPAMQISLDALPGGGIRRYDETGAVHAFQSWRQHRGGDGILLDIPALAPWEHLVLLRPEA